MKIDHTRYPTLTPGLISAFLHISVTNSWSLWGLTKCRIWSHDNDRVALKFAICFGSSGAVAPARCLNNKTTLNQMSRLRDFARSGGNTSSRLERILLKICISQSKHQGNNASPEFNSWNSHIMTVFIVTKSRHHAYCCRKPATFLWHFNHNY